MNLEQDQPSAQDWNQLTDRLDTLERKLDGNVIKNCDKMGNHIDFVNGVYATVKVPLNYIANKFHKIVNPSLHKELELPIMMTRGNDDDDDDDDDDGDVN